MNEVEQLRARAAGGIKVTCRIEPTEAEQARMPYGSESLWFLRASDRGDRAFFYVIGGYCCPAAANGATDCGCESVDRLDCAHGLEGALQSSPRMIFDPVNLLLH